MPWLRTAWYGVLSPSEKFGDPSAPLPAASASCLCSLPLPLPPPADRLFTKKYARWRRHQAVSRAKGLLRRRRTRPAHLAATCPSSVRTKESKSLTRPVPEARGALLLGTRMSPPVLSILTWSRVVGGQDQVQGVEPRCYPPKRTCGHIPLGQETCSTHFPLLLSNRSRARVTSLTQ